jgi:amidase
MTAPAGIDLATVTATELVGALRRRELGSVELLVALLERIEHLDPAVNAVVTTDIERAMAEARAADDAIAHGRVLGRLHGLPMTVKDCLATAGMRTTAGAVELRDYLPDEDAVAVGRLRAAGAVVFGKTNLPAWAGDCQSYNALFGTTNNPWDATRTPGGSSGGAAAAVATGMTPLELGSDLGGSIRIPAHFTGVYGLKPTFGIVPTRGHLPPPPGVLAELETNVVGPLARSAGDLALALDVLAGPDEAAGAAWRLELPPARADRLTGYRVAARLDDPYFRVDRAAQAVLEQVVEALRRAGVAVDTESRPPDLAEGHDVAQRLIQGGFSAALPPEEFDRLLAEAERRSSDDDSPHARWARNITQRARDLNIVGERRLHLQAEWAAYFETYDVLLTPVTPTPAFVHDHDPDVDARTIALDGAAFPYADQFAWLQAVGVAHLPAVSAPAGRTAAGLPVGIHVVGPRYEDRTVIDFAGRLADVAGGFEPPPAGD